MTLLEFLLNSNSLPSDFSRRVAGEEKTSSSLCSFCCYVFIVHIWSQQVYELIAWLRSANQNGRNPIYLVQFLINIYIYIITSLEFRLQEYTSFYCESLKLPDECGPYNFGPYETELSQ